MYGSYVCRPGRYLLNSFYSLSEHLLSDLGCFPSDSTLYDILISLFSSFADFNFMIRIKFIDTDRTLTLLDYVL